MNTENVTAAPAAEGKRPIRVMVVDDHAIVRKGLRALLAETEDLILVAEANGMRQAIEAVERMAPDVVVMDVRLADASGIEVARDIRARRPDVQVLMLSSFADEEAVLAAIMAGAAGYVLKQIAGDDLIRSIRAVAQHQNLLDPGVTKGVMDRIRADSRSPKTGSWPISRLKRSGFSHSSRQDRPTARSASSCTWPMRPSATTSQASSANLKSPDGLRPPPIWSVTGHTLAPDIPETA